MGLEHRLAPKYASIITEADRYDNWKEEGYFTAGDTNKKPYSLVIPPPNVTGKLHLGHAWIPRFRIFCAATSACRDMMSAGCRGWTMRALRHRQKWMPV